MWPCAGHGGAELRRRLVLSSVPLCKVKLLCRTAHFRIPFEARGLDYFGGPMLITGHSEAIHPDSQTRRDRRLHRKVRKARTDAAGNLKEQQAKGQRMRLKKAVRPRRSSWRLRQLPQRTCTAHKRARRQFVRGLAHPKVSSLRQTWLL